MAHVIQVNFDSHWNLVKPYYIFKFRDREYKVLRGKGRKNNKEKDCILSLLGDEDKEYYGVYRDIMIYCGCLSWEYQTPVMVSGGGGYGNSKKITIKQVRRVDITRRNMVVNTYSLSLGSIPYVHTKDQEDAIGLYREALVSASPFYKFLCLWNILNIPARGTKSVISWVNDALENKKHKIFLNNQISALEKKGADIGKYLDEECRDAIAHIRRDSPNRTHIDPNDGRDIVRISSSTYFLENLARLYIADELRLDNRQFLYKRKQRDIPEYLTEEKINCRI